MSLMNYHSEYFPHPILDAFKCPYWGFLYILPASVQCTVVVVTVVAADVFGNVVVVVLLLLILM